LCICSRKRHIEHSSPIEIPNSKSAQLQVGAESRRPQLKSCSRSDPVGDSLKSGSVCRKQNLITNQNIASDLAPVVEN
jgi:hypothetical protein